MKLYNLPYIHTGVHMQYLGQLWKDKKSEV